MAGSNNRRCRYCRKSLEDAAREMVLAYHQMDKEDIRHQGGKK